MSRKGFDFKCEIENVRDDEEFNNNSELKNELKELLFKETPFYIDAAAFWTNRDFLIINGQVVRESRKEAQAEYTIFKEKLLRLFKKYYKKVKLNDIFLGFFTCK